LSSFTWYRGRTGYISGDSTDALLTLQSPVIPVEGGLTIRAFYIRWVLDLLAVDKDGTINSKCPVTLGVAETFSDDDSFDPPPYSPNAAPDYPWRWWDGAVFDNAYNFTSGGSEGVLVASGKIERQAPFIIGTEFTANAALWLSIEVQDVDEEFSGFQAIAWFAVLTAPVVG
jgi:hypothetical protein